MKGNILSATKSLQMLFAALLCLSYQVGHTDADVVIIADHVITMAPGERSAKPLALAIAGEKIKWVGSHEEAKAHIGDATEVVRLDKEAILPGFIDAHGHVAAVGLMADLANIASPPVGPVTNIATLQEELKRYIEDRKVPEGEWVVGRGYDDSLLAESRHPNRDDLDAVSTKHPILLIHVSGHLSAVNSRALARGGINAESPDPPGGHIRRRPNSTEPNGVLEETASSAFRQYMTPTNSPVDNIAAAMRIYASNGITTAQDGGANPGIIGMLKAADAAGKVDIDVVAFPFGQFDESAIADTYEFRKYDGRIKVAGIKLMLDGSPQGKTAYMTRPYKVPPHGQDAAYRGYPNIPQPRVSQLVKHYMANDIPIIAHANGDAAADMLIQAVQDSGYGRDKDHRTVMIHAQTVREDQLTAMKQYGLVPSYFAAHTFYWGDWHRDSVFGVERARRISPSATTLGRGMPFTIHNDAPVVPPDMMRLIWAATNRLTRSNQALGPEQRISTYDAIKAVTLNAAYQHFEDATKGSLEVGKQADLVVLSENPLATDTEALLDIDVLATYSRGRQVFAAQPSSAGL